MTANFQRAEFCCKCGCGADHISDKLVDKLQKLRDTLGRPIRVLSGVRCRKHNTAVGGEKNSFHLIGRAADICVAGMSTAELHAAVEASGLFGGIGLYPSRGFVHVDNRVRPGRWNG